MVKMIRPIQNSPAATRPGAIARRGGVAQGCLIALAVLLAIAIAGGVFVYLNWRGWAASGMRQATTAIVQDAPLSDTEKQEVIDQVDRVALAFENGDIGFVQMGELLERLQDGPLLPAGIAYGAYSEYIEPAELTDDEKTAGRVAMDRVARGIAENTIDPEKLGDVLQPIAAAPVSKGGGSVTINTGSWQITIKPPEDTTPEEIREVIANAATLADEQAIPDERYELDVSEELRKVIDEVLAQSSG